MTRKIKVFFSLSLISLIILAAGCSVGNNSSQVESDSVIQNSRNEPVETTLTPKESQLEETTESTPVTTESIPVTTQEPEYSLVELLTKSVPEILELMDYNITVTFNDELYGGVDGAICFYNFEKLPGFIFSPKDLYRYSDKTQVSEMEDKILSGDYKDLSFIVAKDGAKLNSEISSDMTYNDISTITGIYTINPPAGVGQIKQDLKPYLNKNNWLFVNYVTSKEAYQKMIKNNNRYDEEYIKQENPKVDYILAEPE